MDEQSVIQEAVKKLQSGDFVGAHCLYRKLSDSNYINENTLLGFAICQVSLRQFKSALNTLNTLKSMLSSAENAARYHLLVGDCFFNLRHSIAGFEEHYSNAANIVRQLPKVAADIAHNLKKGLNRIELSNTERRLNLNNQDQNRFKAALEISFGERLEYRKNPSLFFYPELPDREFYDISDNDWCSRLENCFEMIKKEFQDNINQLGYEPYLQGQTKDKNPATKRLIQNSDWSACFLWKDGIPDQAMQLIFPHTFEALSHAPIARIPGRSPNILFSKLKPNTHIPPHTGLLNTRLICHLPLQVPNNCGSLRCGNEFREWEEGKVLAFDDSIEHEAWNCSNSDRVVLIFEIWHPDLSEKERALITDLIKTN